MRAKVVVAAGPSWPDHLEKTRLCHGGGKHSNQPGALSTGTLSQ